MKKSTWLVTGGAGFIGANFVYAALKHSDVKLVVFDALTYAGDLSRLEAILDDPRVTFVKGNICDEDLVEKTFEEHGITHVVHFAAESHVDRSILGPKEFLHSNIEGTFVLLEAAKKHWQTHGADSRFIHVSTDEVYGTLKAEDPPFKETNAFKPNSPYSASKAASDHLARAWYKTYDLPVIITNCCNNYGPWQFPEKLIPLFVSNAVEEKALPVYGDGMQIREWIHVDDHSEAILTVLKKGVPGQTYLIGSGEEVPNLHIIQNICDIVDELLERSSGTSQKLITYVKDRPGHDRRYAIDSTKIESELGWKSQTSFKEGLRETVAWYLEQKDWIKSIQQGDYLTYYEKQYGNR